MSMARVSPVQIAQGNLGDQIELRSSRIVGKAHSRRAGEVVARTCRAACQTELKDVLEFLSRQIPRHQRAAGCHVEHTRPGRGDGKDVIDGLHACIAPGQTVAHQPVGGQCDLGPRGLAECVGAEVREDRAGRKVGGCVRQVPFDPRQWLINGKPAWGENHLGHAFLEPLDDLAKSRDHPEWCRRSDGSEQHRR